VTLLQTRKTASEKNGNLAKQWLRPLTDAKRMKWVKIYR